MYYNILRVKAPLLVIKISKKTSSQSWRLYFALKQNETKHKLISTPRKHPRNARVISAKDLGTMSKSNLRRITLARGPIWGIHSLTLIISWCTLSPIMKNVSRFRPLQVSTSSPGPSPRRFSKSRVPVIHELYEKVVWFFIYSTFNKITSFPWKLNRYSYGVQFGINCTALDQSKLRNFDQWTIIKVREWTLHIGPPTKVIPLKLLLDIMSSSSAEITRALRGCFREGFVYMYVVSFRFISKQRKTSIAVWMSSLIFWLQLRELRLSVCFNTFRNFNRSLNKRQGEQCRLKDDLIFNLRVSREFRFIEFVYTVRDIPNGICKAASNFEKEILKIVLA